MLLELSLYLGMAGKRPIICISVRLFTCIITPPTGHVPVKLFVVVTAKYFEKSKFVYNHEKIVKNFTQRHKNFSLLATTLFNIKSHFSEEMVSILLC
jgi:hypothetical protein